MVRSKKVHHTKPPGASSRPVSNFHAERHPDVVILDIGLPKLNGYQACRAMRHAGLTSSLIVAMTGYGQSQDRQLSQLADFDAHLVKPVNLDSILSLLADAPR